MEDNKDDEAVLADDGVTSSGVDGVVPADDVGAGVPAVVELEVDVGGATAVVVAAGFPIPGCARTAGSPGTATATTTHTIQLIPTGRMKE